MSGIIAQLLLFAGIVVFGLFIPNVFIFAFLILLLVLLEWDNKDKESKKRHNEMMKIQKNIAQSLNYLAKQQMQQRNRSKE